MITGSSLVPRRHHRMCKRKEPTGLETGAGRGDHQFISPARKRRLACRRTAEALACAVELCTPPAPRYRQTHYCPHVKTTMRRWEKRRELRPRAAVENAQLTPTARRLPSTLVRELPRIWSREPLRRIDKVRCVAGPTRAGETSAPFGCFSLPRRFCNANTRTSKQDTRYLVRPISGCIFPALLIHSFLDLQGFYSQHPCRKGIAPLHATPTPPSLLS